MSDSLYLRHYGVKGMKWGVRRARKAQAKAAKKAKIQAKRWHTDGYSDADRDELIDVYYLDGHSRKQAEKLADRDIAAETKSHNKIAKKWMDLHSEIMSMDPEVTKAKEYKKLMKNAIHKTGGYAFG